MSGVWTALAVGIAGPLGAVAILIAAAVAAAGLAERVDPAPRPPVNTEVRKAIEQRRLHEQLDEQMRKAEAARGRESIDSTHVSFPAFGITGGVWLVLTAWAAALEHFGDPGEGFPLALALRPLWSSLIAATLAGLVSGFFYRRWLRRQSPQRRERIRARLRDRERRDFQSRLRSLRERGSRPPGSE